MTTRRRPEPLRYQIRTDILELLTRESYKPGDKLPTESELIELLNVSRSTLREGLHLLEEERIIRTKVEKEKYRFVAIFDSLAGQEFEVKLHEYALEADPVTQTYLITFAMTPPEDIAILPGMTATIWEYPRQDQVEKKLFLVPIDAAPVDGTGQYYVWKINKESDNLYSVQRQNVKVGKIEADKIQILEGLSAGDKIAANGAHMLQEGQKVTEFLPETKEAKP